MKNGIWRLALALMAVVAVSTSCAGEDPVDNGPGKNDTVLLLKASKGVILNDSVDFTKLTVTYGTKDAARDVTSECTFTCKGVQFQGDVFAGNVAGMYDFKASYNGIVSNVVSIRVEPVAVKFVQNLAVFDVTSTWCQFCPIGGGTIQRARKDYAPKVIPMYFHIKQADPADPFEMAQSKDMFKWLDGSGYPTIRFNDKKDIVGATLKVDDFAPYITGSKATAKSGLAIATNYDEAKGELTVEVKAKVVDARYVDQDLRLVGWYTEDSLVAAQTSGSMVIVDYVHNDVVRALLVGESVMGEVIPFENVADGTEFVYRKVVKMNQGWKPKQSYINAYIYHCKGRATKFDTVLNVQRVAFGKSIDYQIVQ